jgi:acylphosphatase
MSTSDRVRRKLLIAGRVQGVWFRDSLRREAELAGVAGSARNLADGRVEAVLEGPPDAVAQLVAWCHHGPPRAQVTSVEVADEAPRGAAAFLVR